MRRNLGDRLGIFEVIAVFQTLPFGHFRLGGDHLTGLPHDLADGVADHGHLADRLGEDMADPFQDFLDRLDPFLGIDEFRGGGVEVEKGLVARPDPEGQGLESALAGIGSLGALLGLEREIEVFEPFGVVGRADGGRQVGGHFPLSLDRLEDCLLPLGQLAQPLHAELDLADDHLVEVARPFLPVSRNEGNGVPLIQKLDDTLHLHAPNLQVLRDTPQVDLDRVVHGDSTLHLVSFGRC